MEQRLKRYSELIKNRPEEFNRSGYPKIIIDSSKIMDFEQTTDLKIGAFYESIYHILVVDLLEDQDGHRYTYERLLVSYPGKAVVIVPFYQGKYVLLKQYRHAMGTFQYGFPRGYAEQELSARENAMKELSEELGSTINDAKRIGEFVADSGICGDKVQVFYVEMKCCSYKNGYEGISDIVYLTEQELNIWLKEGKINDGFTLSALKLLQIRD